MTRSSMRLSRRLLHATVFLGVGACCRTPLPHVEIVEPAPDSVVTAGNEVTVLVYAWDGAEYSDELVLAAFFESSAIPLEELLTNPEPDIAGAIWWTGLLTVEDSGMLRVYATAPDGRVDGDHISLCTSVTDCGGEEAGDSPAEAEPGAGDPA